MTTIPDQTTIQFPLSRDSIEHAQLKIIDQTVDEFADHMNAAMPFTALRAVGNNLRHLEPMVAEAFLASFDETIRQLYGIELRVTSGQQSTSLSFVPMEGLPHPTRVAGLLSAIEDVLNSQSIRTLRLRLAQIEPLNADIWHSCDLLMATLARIYGSDIDCMSADRDQLRSQIRDLQAHLEQAKQENAPLRHQLRQAHEEIQMKNVRIATLENGALLEQERKAKRELRLRSERLNEEVADLKMALRRAEFQLETARRKAEAGEESPKTRAQEMHR